MRAAKARREAKNAANAAGKGGRDIREYDADDYSSEPALLHSGPLLGNLPGLKGVGRCALCVMCYAYACCLL